MLTIIQVPIETLTPNPRNARTHAKKQIRQIADSIREFGFVIPIITDEYHSIIAGHGRLAAAHLLGLSHVPAVQLTGLSDAKKRALRIADNKIAANAGWDREMLAVELADLDKLLKIELLDISLTGFEPVEIDQLAIDFATVEPKQEDEYDPALQRKHPVGRIGDLWLLGHHRLMCGNARNRDELETLTSGEKANAVFTDPPYNVRVADIVGRGRIKQSEFAEASGEMSPEEFISFLQLALGNAAQFSHDGAVHYVCMDWRHVAELMAAAKPIYGAHLNTVVWVKTNAGQGAFYRSQHELVLVYRVGPSKHLNNVQLGRHGRSRTNVWHYAGVNTFRTSRLDDLSAHPTVKPVNLVVDALRDCTRRGDTVLDIFSGSGAILLAAERIGRRALAMEINPIFVDAAIRRWQLATGKDAIRASDQAVFSDLDRLKEIGE